MFALNCEKIVTNTTTYLRTMRITCQKNELVKGAENVKKKITLMLLLFILIMTTAASSNPLSIPFESIKLNDQTPYVYQKKSNLLLDSDVDRIRTLIEKTGETLNARVIFDEPNKQIQLIKPNAQIITTTNIKIEKEKLFFEGVFGKVKLGDKLDFMVYSEIENLPAGVKNFRLHIVGPEQGVALEGFDVSPPPDIASTDKTNATSIFSVSNANFKQPGIYKIKLQMKLEKEEVFYTIAEKNIEVPAPEKKAELPK